MAKVFLSHSSKDAKLADDLHAALTGLRHDTFLDHDPGDGIEPGADWERTLYERLQWADALVCIVSQNYVQSLWCSIEVAIAKAQGRRIVPLSAEAGLLHPLLKTAQHLAYAADAAEALARLAGQLTAIDAGGGVAWNPGRAVFPGLVAFDTDDRAMFFGRDDEVREVVKEIRARVGQRQPRALIVVGGSGSGKSSLVRAGVVPTLLEDPAWWRVRPILPGDAPFRALADALARARKEVGLPPELDRVAAQLQAGELTQVAREILLSAPGDRQHLLITVDQMEELFTRGNGGDRQAFLNALANAVGEVDGPVAVVATLRSEFVGELLRGPEGRLLRERPFLLAPMDAEHLEDVIAKPAQKARIVFDRDLVRRLVADTGSGEALPLLAFTLARLVDGLGPGDRVDLKRYEAAGGVQRSVEIQAEAALAKARAEASCTEADAIAALMSFVTLDEAGRPARRRRRRADLAAASPAIVAAFEQARLLTTHIEEGVELVGVSHETLFTAWGRMAQAISTAAAKLELRRDLEHAFVDWKRAGQSPAYLWRGERLALARRWLEESGLESRNELGVDERTFVQESLQAALAEAKRESDILADRVERSGMLENEPELALLYLLAAADEYTVTPSVVAGMRRALSHQRLVGRVGPIENEILFAMVSDDGELMAVADIGTNPPARPSTRPQPKPPAGEVQLSLWRIADRQMLGSVALHGREVPAIAWSRDRRILAVAIDTRVEVLNAEDLTRMSNIDADGPAGAPALPRDHLRLEISPDNGRIEIGEGLAGKAFVLDQDGSTWVGVGPPAAGSELPEGTRAVPHPARFSRHIRCGHAGRLLDILGTTVDVWSADAVDKPQAGGVAEREGALWTRGNPVAGDNVLDLSSDLRWECHRSPLRLIDMSSQVEQPLPWSFAVAAAFSADGRRLALASRLEIGVVDIASHRIIATMGRHGDEEGDTYSSVALNQDGTVLVSGSLGRGRSQVWDVASGRSLRHVGGKRVGISGDAKNVAATTESKLVVYLEDGNPLEFDARSAVSFAFDAMTSSLLAVGGTIAEYSLPDGSTAAEYPADLEAIAFSADGRHVLGRRGSVTLCWPDRSSDAVIARARKSVYRSLTQAERDDYELHRS